MEAIKISLDKIPYSGGITYKTHVQNYGWLNNVSNGAISGITGERKRMEAIQINLTGDMAKHYDVYYRVHAQSYGWLDWAKNGESAGTQGLSKRLEAIEIVLVEKGGAAPGSTNKPLVSRSICCLFNPCTRLGWLTPVADGATSGTEGESKRLEAIKISLENNPLLREYYLYSTCTRLWMVKCCFQWSHYLGHLGKAKEWKPFKLI